jgi:hypothetical protein
MNSEDTQPGIGNTGNRNFGPPKYPEKMPNYSPSTSYNYGHHGGYSGMQQHPRRRADRFKRETINQSDKLVKQNDLIIRLLKEIRDRLPPPPYQEQHVAQAADAGIPVQDATDATGAPGSQGETQDTTSEGQTSDEQPDQLNDFPTQ